MNAKEHHLLVNFQVQGRFQILEVVLDDEEEVLLVVGLLDEVLGEAVSKPVRKFLLADVRGRIHASENSATIDFQAG